jgi:hypothetical protein
VKKKIKKTTSNQRIDVAPAGGEIATLGYYTSPVQKIVRAWRGKVSEALIEQYFCEVASPIRFREQFQTVRIFEQHHWQLVGELTAAIAKVLTDKTKIDYWLLTLPISVATSGKFPIWEDVREQIRINGGGKFEAGTIAKHALRLRLVTPPKIAADYLATRPTTSPSYRAMVRFSAKTKRRR